MAEPSTLTPDTIRQIAELAKLELSDDEVERYRTQLSDILDYFQRLQTVDTSHIEPTASVLPLRNVLRADKAEPALSPDEAIANAPDSDDHQFRVSAVLPE